MHELSLARSVVEIVAEEAESRGFARVSRVRLRVGALAPVEPEALRFCFDAAALGTAVEGATLDIVPVAGEGVCADCGRTVALSTRFDACSACGGRHVRLTRGAELQVNEIEVG